MRALLLLVLVTLLVACADSESEPSTATSTAGDSDPATPSNALSTMPRPDATSTAATDPATFTPASPIDTPTTAAPVPEEPVILFSKEGGFVGISQTWAIYADGQILSEQDAVCLVDSEKVSDIQSSAADSGFFELTFPEAEPICCDFFTFTLTIRSEDSVNTVIVSEGDPKMPQELRELLNFVQQIISACEK